MLPDNLPDAAIEHLRLLSQESLADTKSVAYFKDLDTNRLIDRQEMIELLNDYLSGKISSEELRATFDLKTRSEWNTFGFKGMSGAMFLNMLVKNITDEDELAKQLRQVLRVPVDANEGRGRMRTFMQFLESLISSHQATKRQIQPARTLFLSVPGGIYKQRSSGLFSIHGRDNSFN